MYTGEERRKHKRIKKRFIVSFQIRSGNARERLFAKWDMVAVLDLGAGGVLFYYNKKMTVGSGVELKINLSPDKDPVNCIGKVIRVERLPYDFMCLVAVVFTDISEKQKKLIDKIAEDFLTKKTKLIET